VLARAGRNRRRPEPVHFGKVLDEVAERPVGAAGDADIRVRGARDAFAQGSGAVLNQGQQVLKGRYLGHPDFVSPGTDSCQPGSTGPAVTPDWKCAYWAAAAGRPSSRKARPAPTDTRPPLTSPNWRSPPYGAPQFPHRRLASRDIEGTIRTVDPVAASRNYQACRQLSPDHP